jgi:RimJ/RimL family protein N-acetyltransferase
MLLVSSKIFMLNEGRADLETDRLVLEPLRVEHAGHLFAVLSDPRIYTFIPKDPPASLLTLENRYRQLESRISTSGEELWLNWAIGLKDRSQYIGTVQATILKSRSSSLAYELSPDFWGHGYATEACLRVIESLFTDYDVSEVVAEVDTRNEASCKLLERLSFKRIEMRANADFFKGASSDEYTYKLSRMIERHNNSFIPGSSSYE